VVLGGAALAGDSSAIKIASAWQRRRGREQGRTGMSGRLWGILLELVMDLPYRMGEAGADRIPCDPPDPRRAPYNKKLCPSLIERPLNGICARDLSRLAEIRESWAS
jgi:hypothetical protein